MTRLLVVDGYTRAGRAELVAGGASEAGRLYARRLKELRPEARVTVGYPADPDWSASSAGLSGFDGIVWTGSSLTIYREEEAVRRQLELAREAFRLGLPSFGSCWAAQLAVVAAGGSCARNVRGREFGVARKIALTAAGRVHPLFEGKGRIFDAFTSHQDEITTLPRGATWLASNAFTRVQAVEVRYGAGRFWALQYHPEYDLHEVARLTEVRTGVLVEEGRFAGRSDAKSWIEELEALHRRPERSDLRFRLALDADLLDPAQRMREVANWLAHEVEPRARHRLGGSRAGLS